MFNVASCAGVVCFSCSAGKPTCFADCCGSLIFSIKSEGEQEKRGSCNSAYSLNFQHLKRCADTHGFVVMRSSLL